MFGESFMADGTAWQNHVHEIKRLCGNVLGEKVTPLYSSLLSPTKSSPRRTCFPPKVTQSPPTRFTTPQGPLVGTTIWTLRKLAVFTLEQVGKGEGARQQRQ